MPGSKSRVLSVVMAVAVVAGGLSAGLTPASARPVAAADVRCEPRGCVDARDLAPSSVKRGKIEEGAVTSTKIADGTVTEADLAFDPLSLSDLDGYVSQVELDELAGGLATGDGSAPNAGSNLVHWQNIVGMPAGFADGSDEVGGSSAPAPSGPATDVDCTGCVGTDDVAHGAVTTGKLDGTLGSEAVDTSVIRDDAVTEAKLDFDPATQSELDAFEQEIGNESSFNEGAGAPNETTDPLSWFKLRDIPTDIADGDSVDGGTAADLDCTGCLTSVDLGLGSVVGGTEGDVADGSITSHDLAGTYADGVQTVVGAVTSEKIADGTIQKRDMGLLAISTSAVEHGAITTQQMTANASASVVSDSLSGGVGSDRAAAMVIVPAGASHVVHLTGQMQVSCSCGLDEVVTGSWYLTRQVGGQSPTVISPTYQEHLTDEDTNFVASISFLDHQAPAGEMVTYRLIGGSTSTGTTVADFTKALLIAVDLGQV